MIFFTNFLAVIIQAEFADRNSNSSTVYSVLLILVHVFFILSICWNSLATMKATLSRRHVQVWSRILVDRVFRLRLHQTYVYHVTTRLVPSFSQQVSRLAGTQAHSRLSHTFVRFEGRSVTSRPTLCSKNSVPRCIC